MSPLPPVARAQPAAAPKRALVLYSYRNDYPWNVAFDRSFRATLQSAPAGSIEYYSEYLESDRFRAEIHYLALHDYLLQKYADRTIDVVVACSDASLNFLLKYRDTLFPHTPIVFITTRRFTTAELAAGSGLTGIANINTSRKTLDLALRLHPGTKQVFVISGNLERDKNFERLARDELQGYEGKVAVTYLTDFRPDILKVKMKSLPDRSVVLYLWQQSQGEQGTVLETEDILALIAQSAAVPIYGVTLLCVGKGIIGGYLNLSTDIGPKAAELVLRIANGTRAKDIPVADAPAVPVFDWRQLRRWGISESKLPAGSIIRFRELTVWDQYGWHIIAVLAFCLLQAILIGKLLIERRSGRKASDSLARLNSELQRKMAEITTLSGRLISAQEDERGRISRELHDDLSQQAAALGIRLSLIKRDLGSIDTARDAIAAVQRELIQLTTSIHALSHELHPPLLEQAGLAPALRAHCEEFETVHGVKAHLTADLDRRIPAELALCLYRITQEALRNVVKHSGAKEAWVSLAEVDNHIHLTIEDAGRGFDPQKVSGSGIGLVSMKERVRLVGGTFEVDSKLGGGTVTRVVVPMRAQFAATV